MSNSTVVLDTNVFVAAGFYAQSHSARLIERVRRGQLRMVWTESTRAETRYVLEKIPPLDWDALADLFRDENRAIRIAMTVSSIPIVTEPSRTRPIASSWRWLRRRMPR